MTRQDDYYQDVAHSAAGSERLASRVQAVIAHLRAEGQPFDSAETQKQRHQAMAAAYRAHKQMLEARIMARKGDA